MLKFFTFRSKHGHRFRLIMACGYERNVEAAKEQMGEISKEMVRADSVKRLPSRIKARIRKI